MAKLPMDTITHYEYDGKGNINITITDLIRCKDCKHAHLTYNGECKHCDKWTDEFGIPEELYLDGDFYCSYAERRIDD